MKNSKIILPLLAVGVIVSFYYAWQDMQPVDPVNKGTTGIHHAVDSLVSKALASGRFDFSGGERRKFRNPSRNLFNQLFPAPPAPKVVAAAPVVPPPPVVVTVAQAPPPPMPVPVRTPSTRMPAFQVLGFLEKRGQLTAFLSLQGEIYLVKKEQLFANEFRVSALTSQNITIARVSDAGEVSLPLSEKSGSMKILDRAGSRPAPRSNIPTSRPELQPAMPVVHPPIGGSAN